MHSVGWQSYTTTADKNAIIQVWQGHQWGIEMGYTSSDLTTRQNAYKTRYLDRGIQAKFITVNAYSSSRIPDPGHWADTVQAYYNKGVAAGTPIYATFEYQNMAEYQTTLMQNLVSDRADFQQIISTSGGMTIDIPPTVYFKRINSTTASIRKYHDWILDAINWAQSRDYTVGIIMSPNSAKKNYDEDTQAFIEILTDENALPDFFVVENYDTEDPSTYDNEVGNEDTPHHQLGCALLTLTQWYAPPVEGPTSGLVAHWPLDEGSGTTVTNIAGSSYTAQIENGATWGSDATRDSYVSFDGIDDRIATTFTYALADTNDFTWAWWANHQGADTGTIMVGNRYGNTGAETYEFIKFTPVSVQLANTSDTSEIERYDYADIPSDEWHHYAMVKDGTSYQWYVDGVAEGSPQTFTYNETTPLPFLIGGDTDNKPNEHFEGAIDDVVLYRQALTPTEINNVINGIYLPVVTLITTGTPVDQATATAWSDGLAPHGGAEYVIPDTGNVKGESGTTTFPGNRLTVEAGGKFQVRALKSSSQVMTVNNLMLEGGTGGTYAQLAAGTGNNETNVLDGNLKNAGSSRFVTYGSTINRSLEIVSKVSGTGILQASGGATVLIDNTDNSFTGTWQVDNGATLQFNSSEAVGAADIEVLGGGTLKTSNDWNSDATLTVADAASTQVDFGANTWLVSNLVFSGSNVADGSYFASRLNALGANAVFTGTGTLIVNSGGTISDTLYSNASDAGVKEDGSIENLTGLTSQVGTGGSNPWVDRAVVYVFELPDLGMMDNPFLSSSFSFNVAENNSVKNSDLYGIGKRSASTVLGSDYYGQTATADPTDAMRIQSDILTGSTTTGIITAGNGALADYLNAQYDGGNGIGQYIFLRLNSATAKTSINRAALTMSEGGVAGPPDTRPQLSFTAINYSGSSPAEPPIMQVEQVDGNFTFSWSNSTFKLQCRTNLTEGTWLDYDGGISSPVTVDPTNSTAFFRLIEQ